MSAGVLFDAPGPKARRRHFIASIFGVLLMAAIIWVVYKRLDDKGQFTSAMWKPFTQSNTWVNFIWPGLQGTIKAAAVALVLSAVLGVVFAMLRMAPIKAVRWIAGAVVEVARAVPVLIVMLFTYGLLTQSGLFPNMDPEKQAPFIATVAGLVTYNSAVVAEVIRAGVGQLPGGQREAGLSVGLSETQTLRMILLPQAITAMMPALISQLVVVIKDTALGYNVLYHELLYDGKNASVVYGNIVPMMFVLALIYIVINYSVSKLAVFIEGRIQKRGKTAGKPLAATTAEEEIVAPGNA